MTRRIKSLTRALYFLMPQLHLYLPQGWSGNPGACDGIAAGDRRPYPAHRRPGWSERRRRLRGL